MEELCGGELKEGTAFYAFVSHVKLNDDGTVDVSGVFTPKCYADWLASRGGSVQKPEKAFHRAFVTHMRGINHRRPFPAIIEQALLKELRRPENIWDKVFIPNTCKIGRYGFTYTAFHEGKTSDLDAKPPLGSTPGQKKARKRILGDDALLSTIELGEAELGLVGVHDIFSENHLIAEAWKDLMDMNTSHGAQEVHPYFETNPWDTFWKGAVGHESFIYGFESLVKNDGYNIFPPALIFLMQLMPSRTDQRFNFDFLFPNPLNVQFNPNRPVGYMKTDILQRKVVDCNNLARTILKGEPIGKHMMHYVPSMMEFFLGEINSFSKYHHDEISWKRVLLRDHTGRISLYLAQIRMPIASYQHELFFQDISELYPDYLLLPFFI